MRLIAQIAALRGFRSPSHRCAPARAERLFHMNATRAPFTLSSARNRNPPDGRAASSLPRSFPALHAKLRRRPFQARCFHLKCQLCRASPSRNEQMIVPRLCVADVSVHPPPQTAPCSFGFGTNAPNGQILNKSAEMIKKTAIEPLCSRFGHGDSAVYCALSRGNL